MVLPFVCVLGCGKTTDIPAEAPVALEKGRGELANELSSDEARELIPRAAAMSMQEYLDILDHPPVRVGEIKNHSLTAILLAVDPFQASRQNAGADAGFRYLTPADELPNPEQIRSAVLGRDGAEFVSIIQPEYITKCTCLNQGEIATGHIRYRAGNLYEGSADFTARRQGEDWQIIAFHVPEYRMMTKRQSDGRWRLVFEEQLLGVGWP